MKIFITSLTVLFLSMAAIAEPNEIDPPSLDKRDCINEGDPNKKAGAIVIQVDKEPTAKEFEEILKMHKIEIKCNSSDTKETESAE